MRLTLSNLPASAIVMGAAFCSTSTAVFAFSCPSTQTSATVYSVANRTEAATFSAIQAAIDLAQTKSSKTVVVGSGDYPLSIGSTNADVSSLILKSGVSLCAPNGATFRRASGVPNSYILATPVNATAAQSISNITFEGSGIYLRGGNATVTNSTFNNITLTATEKANGVDRFYMDGVRIANTATGNNTVTMSSFNNIDHAGVQLEGGPHAITVNTFNTVYQGIGGVDVHDIRIDSNTIKNIGRMGIEFIASSQLPGILIQNNLLYGWQACTGAIQDCGIGISVAAGASPSILANTVHCELSQNCKYGLEVGTTGTANVYYNNVSGFQSGVKIHGGDIVNVGYNAIYSADEGISKSVQNPVTNQLNVEFNQIENAKTAGIDGEMRLVLHPSITNNFITRTVGSWSSDCVSGTSPRFDGIVLQAPATGAPPSQQAVIAGNRVHFDASGSSSCNLTSSGILLGGYMGSLSGLTIQSNWVGALGNTSTLSDISGIWPNSNGSSTGVTLSNNRFQGLTRFAYTDSAISGYEYISSGNIAINMPAQATHANGINSVTSATVNAVTMTPTSPYTVPGGGAIARLVATGTGSTCASQAWYLGMGDFSTKVTTSVTTNYLPRFYLTHPFAQKIRVLCAPSITDAISVGTILVSKL